MGVKKTKKPIRSDATVIFEPERTGRPPSNMSPLLDSDTMQIDRIRENLSKCTVRHDESGISFENFLNNLRGVSAFSVCGVKFAFLRTRSHFFVLSNKPPETLYDLSQALMDVDFKKKCILESAEGKPMFMCRLGTGDLEIMMSAAAKEKSRKKRPGKGAEREGLLTEMGFIDVKRFRKICDSFQLLGKPSLFDLRMFSEGVNFITSASDEGGSAHLLVIAGNHEDLYRIYLGEKQRESENYYHVCTLKYGGRVYTICKEY